MRYITKKCKWGLSIAASDSNRVMTGPEETRFPLSGLCDGIASGAFSRGLVLKQSGHVCTVRQRCSKRYQEHSLTHYATPFTPN